MYRVSGRYSWHYGTDGNRDTTELMSVAIDNPENIHVVDRESFPCDGREHHVSVTPRTIYLADPDSRVVVSSVELEGGEVRSAKLQQDWGPCMRGEAANEVAKLQPLASGG